MMTRAPVIALRTCQWVSGTLRLLLVGVAPIRDEVRPGDIATGEQANVVRPGRKLKPGRLSEVHDEVPIGGSAEQHTASLRIDVDVLAGAELSAEDDRLPRCVVEDR